MYEIEGCPVPVYQDESEFYRLLELVKNLKPKRILEIGSLYGGTLWYWMQNVPGVEIVSVDIGVGAPDSRHKEVEYNRLNLWDEWARQTGSKVIQIRADSMATSTIDQVRAHIPFDFVFIDGGHKYNEVMSDWQNYWPMLREGGLLAMHDIAYSDNNVEGYGVPQVWREVRDCGEWQEFIAPHNLGRWMGIGVMWRKSQ